MARISDTARLEASRFVRENSIEVAIHLLGAGEDFAETKRVLDGVNIRSMDTSLAYMLAKEGKEISFTSTRPKSSIDFSEEFINEIGFINHKKFMDEKIKEKE